MNSIDKHSKIDEQKLSKEFFFQSLLQEAYIQGELSQLESERIQGECLKLLSESTERYTKGQSSSVSVEIAQNIMASNLYTISIYLKSLPNVSTAIYHIIHEPIEKLYEYGYKIIIRKLNVAKYFFHQIDKTKISTQNHTYNATIETGLKPFFEQYNVNFGTHEIPGSIDYQLIHPVTDLAGVEYIIQYLENLYYENLFCQKFDADIIHEVMCGYDENYKDLLENLCEQVLQNALGCIFLKKPVQSLDLNLLDIQKIENELQGKKQPFIFDQLLAATNEMFEDLEISNTSVEHYLLSNLPKIALKICTALETSSIEKVFVPRFNPHSKTIVKYYMGVKMDDKTYRDIVSELLSCRYFEDKLQIIKEYIKTLADMEDIIIAGQFSAAEASTVFDLLDDIEVAALIKHNPINQEVNVVEYSEAEVLMQKNLKLYLETIPTERLANIHKTMATIEVI
ncbi:DUF6179 domain-containing protein [Acetobacterium tundrae]|uniref:Uncharacterized protein n=1 Tax=Acetobacterium tundrae TaxID=132932 RepID=A0ABR6WJ27_9FIRM|nr:DUF6179 domain-containing protein [Acetobacterium tundrae]MBC3796303.1 hypothetical protein [Acetobacterium tundrae]